MPKGAKIERRNARFLSKAKGWIGDESTHQDFSRTPHAGLNFVSILEQLGPLRWSNTRLRYVRSSAMTQRRRPQREPSDCAQNGVPGLREVAHWGCVLTRKSVPPTSCNAVRVVCACSMCSFAPLKRQGLLIHVHQQREPRRFGARWHEGSNPA